VVETARVRVSRATHDHEELVDELLQHEKVEVERIPVGQTIETMPSVRQEGDVTIIPVVEEILVVERRLVLKEEVHIRRIKTTERHSGTDQAAETGSDSFPHSLGIARSPRRGDSTLQAVNPPERKHQ
jgi:stress response protein YsnF